MQRFFFHVYDHDVAKDDEGHLFPNLAAAVDEAIRGARGLASEQVVRGRLHLGHQIEITDKTGAVLAVIKFRDAFVVED